MGEPDATRWGGGPLIDQHRIRVGMSWRELAERSGIAKSYVYRIVRDPDANPGITTLLRIAHALKVPVNALTGERAGDDYAAGYADALQRARGLHVANVRQLDELLEAARAGTPAERNADDAP